MSGVRSSSSILALESLLSVMGHSISASGVLTQPASRDMFTEATEVLKRDTSSFMRDVNDSDLRSIYLGIVEEFVAHAGEILGRIFTRPRQIDISP
jgi:hypothetical protein